MSLFPALVSYSQLCTYICAAKHMFNHLNFFSIMNYVSDYALECMSMEQANKFLTPSAKQRWVDLHNKTAHVFNYFLGEIQKVPAEGWWY